MTMIEKVARALAVVHGTDADMLGPGQMHVAEVDGISTLISDHRGPLWMMYVPEARAALEAMREPTADMLAAFVDGDDPGYTADWQAMIDAALAEGATE